ncbi:mannitol dehydrogenase family protein [Curtobacterium sp. VKM Ac-2889]|uniref:mannitol dehydrogenase family protein n=1 Tax=unclassified Curtobacterium TaxID=257496 RepID=UPI00188CC380|nr:MULTISPECIES: mannitol dehydrogenase family protein [unclassified Curtobacterium]MBF4596061.1 mannitol dehydrogenase family protein [Curtobacterium sp. VKM Ac-1796]MBF4611177.1 mannitol dehydrogenase family protein [Curtobacterium sp. VKM Ac-2889]
MTDRRPGIVHVGVGAFARAHLAWYTAHTDGEPWGITAFTGRSPDVADALTAQGCRYTLVTRAASGDSAEVVDTITAAHPGSDDTAWRHVVASPETTIVTLTVTEQGYRPGSDVPARLVAGLDARRTAGSGRIALVSLDNLTHNGAVLRDAVLDAVTDDALRDWIEANVTFPSSMVDRITPATTDDDVAHLPELPGALAGDRVPVVTEPFAEWVLEDAFDGIDRPAWQTAGVRIVDDVTPYEQRKLWLLNGSHSLLAYLGLQLGHDTVAEAMDDPVCRTAVEQLWDEAALELPLPEAEVTDARAALVERFANPRIRHTLRQIASGGSQKLPVRIVDVVRHRLSRDPSAGIGAGAATALAAWWLHVTGRPDLVGDPGAPGPDSDVHDVLAVVAPELDTTPVVAAVTAAAEGIRTAAAAARQSSNGGVHA